MSRVTRALTLFTLVVATAHPIAASAQVGSVVVSPGAIQVPQRPPGPITGTGTIQGRVTLDDGRPVADAEVQATGPALRGMVSTTTDLDGRFVLSNMPAGMISVNANKSGLVGQGVGNGTQSQRPSKSIQLQEGGSAEVAFTFRRGGVVTGRIVDALSEPMSNVQVTLLRKTYPGGPFAQGEPRLTPVTQGGPPPATNDLGEFRLFGIPPGRYYLSATYRRMGPPLTSSTATTYSPTYYPNTVNFAEAQPIEVTAGSVRDGILIMLTPVKASTISGVVVGEDGQPITGQRIGVNASLRGVASSGSSLGAPVKTDGTFQLTGAPPGEYVVRASLPPPSTPPPQGWRPTQLIAFVNVDGGDVSGVVVAPVKNVTISGRIEPDAASAADFHPERIQIMAAPASPDAMMLAPGITRPTPVNADGTFQITTAAVPIFIQLMGAAPSVRSIRVAGVDVTDSPIPVSGDISDLEIDVTTHGPQANFTFASGSATAQDRVSLLVFPADPRQWEGTSRRFFGLTVPARMPTPPPQAPRFPGFPARVPAGKYYAIAVDSIDMSTWRDPDVLQRLAKQATSFELREGDKLAMEIPIVRWKD